MPRNGVVYAGGSGCESWWCSFRPKSQARLSTEPDTLSAVSVVGYARHVLSRATAWQPECEVKTFLNLTGSRASAHAASTPGDVADRSRRIGRCGAKGGRVCCGGSVLFKYGLHDASDATRSVPVLVGRLGALSTERSEVGTARYENWRGELSNRAGGTYVCPMVQSLSRVGGRKRMAVLSPCFLPTLPRDADADTSGADWLVATARLAPAPGTPTVWTRAHRRSTRARSPSPHQRASPRRRVGRVQIHAVPLPLV